MTALPPPIMPVPIPDPATFRHVCGSYATGVAIVATREGGGRPCGLTINSFSSVSLDPPLILWSLDRRSPTLPCFEAGAAAAISILAEGQGALARRFASPAADRFAGVAWEEGAGGAPLIAGAIAHLECSAHDRIEAGDHVVFLWRVTAARRQGEHPPLAFHGGAFRRIAAFDRAEAA